MATSKNHRQDTRGQSVIGRKSTGFRSSEDSTVVRNVPNPLFLDKDADTLEERMAQSAFALSYSAQVPESATSFSHSRSVQEKLEPDLAHGGRGQDVAISIEPLDSQAGEEMDPPSNPPLPVFLKFENVEYSVQPRTPPGPSSWNARKAMAKVGSSPARKQILNGITGSVAPGEILAMMGPSGSGKTTMLNILGGRLTTSAVTGSVTYNNVPYSTALKRRIGFVTQDDVLFPNLTVKETLVFAALLRLPASMSKTQKIQRAETVLRELGLERCQNTIVGGPWKRGVSGGERKRTSIGFEILVDPSLLFLDEPTSGLDSTTALRILQVLQKTAQAGRSIVTTIHQPSSRMFHMFDRLILLSEGHTLYSGKANEATQYFASVGFVPELAMNPADFIMDLATGITHNISVPQELRTKTTVVKDGEQAALQPDSELFNKKLEGRTQTSDKQVDEDMQPKVLKYLRTMYITELEPREKAKMQSLPQISDDQTAGICEKRQWTTSWWEQFLILGNRTFKERYTDYFTFLRLAQTVGTAVLLGLLWWKSKLDTPEHIQDEVGLMFYMVIYWSSFAIFITVSTFPLERAYLVKERAADMYRLSAYYVSSTLCDFFSQLVYPTVFMCVVYYMVGLHNTPGAFFLTILTIYLVNATGQGIGEFIGASVMDMKNSSIIASLTLLVMMLTGGYYVQHIPKFIAWLKYLSFIFYSFRLLVKVQYSAQQTYHCSPVAECSLQEAPSFHHIGLTGGFLQAWVLLLMVVLYRVMAYWYLSKLKPVV